VEIKKRMPLETGAEGVVGAAGSGFLGATGRIAAELLRAAILGNILIK
jgi:hypothetical protein